MAMYKYRVQFAHTTFPSITITIDVERSVKPADAYDAASMLVAQAKDSASAKRIDLTGYRVRRVLHRDRIIAAF